MTHERGHTVSANELASGLLADEFSMFDVLTLLFRHIRLLVWVPLGGAALFAALLLVTGRNYEAESRFFPQSQDASALNRYSGLAAQFGVALPASGGETVTFYATVVKSRDLLESLIRTEFRFRVDEEDTLQGNLLDLYEIEQDSREEEMAALVKQLRDEISAEADVESGTVQVEVEAPWPQLAEQMNRVIITLVDDFNVSRRQSQARAQRRFVEQRLEETRRELLAAENATQEFLEGNRSVASSPELMFERARLQRRVDLSQQLYLMLAQSLEQAKIDEVRDVPVLTIISSPEGSAEPATSIVLTAIFGFLFGGIGAVALILVIEYARVAAREDPEKMRELRTRVRSLFGRSRV